MNLAGPEDAAPDFWLTSGFHLLQREPSGHLVVTDDFLRAYLDRPELRPIAESASEEIVLHRALLAEPRLAVSSERLEALPGAEIRDNYRLLLDFRDRLAAAPTLEACYLAMFRDGPAGTPPLFVDQLAHVILRNVLEGCTDPYRLRAAELLFRRQKVGLQEGAIMLADEETIELRAAHGRTAALATAAPAQSVEIDILDADNASQYWARSDRFDMALDIAFARPGLDALCRVLEAWVRHFLGVAVSITPVQAIRDERWAWHVGLDGEASAILNDLYDGREVDAPRLHRILSLFRLDFAEPAAMLPQVAGRPVYLALAMGEDGTLRMKPQNLLVNLPLAAPA